MALKRITQMPAFQGVAASSKATLTAPVGGRYHALHLVYDNGAHDGWTDANVCNDIDIKLNGKSQRIHSASELNGINSLYNEPGATWGTAATANYSTYDNTGAEAWLTCFFAEPWRPGGIGASLAWSTGGLASFQVEVNLGSASGPVLRSFAEVDNAVVTLNGIQQAAPPGLIVKWRRYNLDVTGGSVRNWTTLPKQDVLLSAHFFANGTQYVTDAVLKADNYEWRNVSDEDMGHVLRSRGMNPTVVGATAGRRFDLVMDYDDGADSAGLRLDGIQDLRFDLTIGGSGSGSVVAMVQTLGRPD